MLKEFSKQHIHTLHSLEKRLLSQVILPANSLVTEVGYYDKSETYHLYCPLNYCCLELGYCYFIVLDFSPCFGL